MKTPMIPAWRILLFVYIGTFSYLAYNDGIREFVVSDLHNSVVTSRKSKTTSSLVGMRSGGDSRSGGGSGDDDDGVTSISSRGGGTGGSIGSYEVEKLRTEVESLKRELLERDSTVNKLRKQIQKRNIRSPASSSSSSIVNDSPVQNNHNSNNKTIESPNKINDGAPSSSSNSNNNNARLRLTNDWKEFHTQWSSDQVTLTNYLQANNQSLPFQKLQDYIKGVYVNPPPDKDVILASHTSVDKNKLDRVDTLQRFWQGPISLAVRIRSQTEIDEFFDYFEYQLPTSTSSTWTVHFLFEYFDHLRNVPVPIRSSSSRYPTHQVSYCHNTMRNLAMHSAAIPDFVLPGDLDFVPTFGAYPQLRQILKEHPELFDKMKNQQKLLVLPVFEALHIPDSWNMDASTVVAALKKNNDNDVVDSKDDSTSLNCTELLNQTLSSSLSLSSDTIPLTCKLFNLTRFESGVESDLPKSREELEVLYKNHAVRQWHYIKGHEASNYTEYWSFKKPGSSGSTSAVAATYPITPTFHYEPYFIGYKNIMPKYWEGFRGFGLNKQSFVRECLFAGFTMEAFYQLYLIHLAHPSNKKIGSVLANSKIWSQHFKPYLKSKYYGKFQDFMETSWLGDKKIRKWKWYDEPR